METGHACTTEDLFIESLEQRLLKNSNDIQALIHKAVMLYEPYHRPTDAAKILQLIIDKDPYNVDAYFWRAEFFYSWHALYEEAERCLRTALTIDSNRADCHKVLASVLLELNVDTQEAEYHYRKAFTLEPTWIGPRRFLASVLRRRGDLKGAKHELEEALKYIGDGTWPTNNPVEEYYESFITGRLDLEGKKRILDFIKEIDEAEAAAKLEAKE